MGAASILFVLLATSFNLCNYCVEGQPENGLIYLNSENKHVHEHEYFTELGPKSHPDLICDTYPTLHAHKNERPNLLKDYLTMSNHRYTEYHEVSAPGTLRTENMFTKSFLNAEYIYWGFGATVITQSLSGYPAIETGIETDAEREREVLQYVHTSYRSNRYKWNFVDPQDLNDQVIKLTTVLNDPDVEEYIVYAGNSVGLYQHFLMDHIGYIAYFRKTMGPKTKLIIPDAASQVSSQILKSLDPKFVQDKMVFLQCFSFHNCNHRLIVEHPTATLKVVTPQSTARHSELLQMARDWVREVRPPNPNSPKKIIYYTRNSLKDGMITSLNKHTRAMDINQELVIVRTIRRKIMRYHRSEELVIFDGSMSFDEQVELFQSASIVIGAHGGGLANLIFSSLDAKSCADRTKVLEFKTNYLCPDLQFGRSSTTFYFLFTKASWTEFHHIHYIPPSDGKTTYIDTDELNSALNSLMSERTETNALRAVRDDIH